GQNLLTNCCRLWEGLIRRFLSIIAVVPWTDLFVVEQDGVPFGKSFQYPCGTLHRVTYEISSQLAASHRHLWLGEAGACEASLLISITSLMGSSCFLLDTGTSSQAWADAFRSSPDLTGIVQVYEELKRKGIEFPTSDLETLSPIHTPQRVRVRANGYVGLHLTTNPDLCILVLLIGAIGSRGRLHPT
ncbi:hypothetical protein XENOCAPTIV_009984, partial [Xenoophorus captivus]